MDWEQRCKELQQRVAELERENQELRRKLGYPERVQSVVMESFKAEVIQERMFWVQWQKEELRLF